MKKSVGGTDTVVEVGSGSGIAASFIAYEYTATANQTTFSGSDNYSNTLAYNTGTPPKVQVFMNGILLDEGSSADYTGTNGTSVVLTTAASAGDLVQIHAYKSDVSIVSNLSFADNQKLQFGDSQDLQIYHDGSHSYVRDVGTGNLKLQGTNLNLQNEAGTKNYLVAVNSGAVQLYHNNNSKIQTTSTGVNVTGNIVADGGTIDGTFIVDGGTGVASAGILHVRQSGNGDGNGIALTSGHATSHRIWKNASGVLNIGSSSNTNAFQQDLTGNITIEGTIDSGAITSSSGITASGPFKSGGSNNYILFDYDGDFTGGNYYAIQDTSANRLRISYGFSSTDNLELDSSGNFYVNGGNATFAGTISSGAITSTGASSGRYTGLEVVNSTNAGGTETAIGLGVVAAGNSACDVKLVANRVGANSGSDFYIEQTDSLGSQQETFRIAETGNATFAGTISSGAITSTSSITANSGGNVIQIGTDGNIEITRTSGGAYIDFKDSSSEDYDQRIQATSTGHNFSGTISSGAITSTGSSSFGNITTTGYLRGPSTFTIDPATHGDDTGTLVIAGNLQVDGTTTTINSTTLTVDDKNITLASGSTNKAAANGAGLTVDCGSDTDATLTYHATGDRWELNKTLRWTYATATTALALNNNNIIEVNNIAFSDPGFNEGLSWSGGNIRLFESPNDLSNASGNLQVTYGGTRRFTVDNTGIDVNGTISSGAITSSSSITAGTNLNLNNGYAFITAGNTSNTTLERVLWSRSQAGASVVQINVKGDEWQFGGGGTLDTTPILKLKNSTNLATFSGDIKTTGLLEVASAQPRILLDRGDGSYSWNIYNGDGTGNFPLSTFNIANNAGTAVITALDNGNVGIGTTNPREELEVNGTIFVTPTLYSANVNDYIVKVGASNNTGWDGMGFKLKSDGSGSPYISVMGGVGAETMVWKSSKVGIGTTSPQAKLHVDGTTIFDTATGAQPVYITRLGNTNESLKIHCDDRGAVFESIQDETADTYGNFIFAMDSGVTEPYFDVRKGTADSASIFRVDGSGTVGIGTDSPSRLLEIEGSVPAVRLSDTSLSGMYHEILGDGNSLSIEADDGNVGSSSSINFKVDGSEKVRIDSSGRVGIGTSSPLDLLHIKSTSTDARQVIDGHTGYDAELKFAENGTVKYTIGHDAASDNFVIGTTNVDTQQRLVINSVGNIGIGDDSPDFKLAIRTPAIPSGSTFAWPLDLSRPNTDGRGLSFGVGASGGPHAIAAHNGDIHIGQTYGVDSNSLPQMYKTLSIMHDGTASEGKVGIGTETLTNKFHVSGNARIEGNLMAGGASASNVPARPIHVKSAGDAAAIRIEDTTSSNTVFDFRVTHGEGLRFINVTGGITPLFVGTDGQVGIGTDSPDTKLDVTTSGVNGILLNQDTASAATSSRLMFKDNVRTNLLINVNGILQFRTDATVNSSSGTTRFSVSPSLAKSEVPLRVEECQIDTTATSTTATTQVAIDFMAAATFRTARYTVQITNVTDSTYQITEILLIHDGTTPSITEYGTIYTGSAAEASFDADITSGNVRLLATPASTDSMQFKVVRHSILV